MADKYFCLDCKGITIIKKQKGSDFIESLLWLTLFFPGFLYSVWRKKGSKKECQYCGGHDLIPADSPYIHDLKQ